MTDIASAGPSGALTNGSVEYTMPEISPAAGSKNTVLTLFGGDRQAKQLFSSLGKRKSPDNDDLSEQALPNGISTAEVIPTHSLDDGEDQKVATFRECFPPPPTLAPLIAPRPSKYTTSRSGPVTWYTPSAASRKIVDRRTFATQALPTGNWLTYNAPPAPRQHSPETKRKQRDRALSFGEAQSPTNDEATAAHNQVKDDALFRSVYSSFAPDRDDSLAIITTQEKSRMWYARYGNYMYQDLLDVKYHVLYGDDIDDDEQDEGPISVEEIKEAVDNWVPPESAMRDPLLVNGVRHSSKKDADEVLAEISDLLETLNSHQRIRYETLPTATRSSTGSIPTVTGNSTHTTTSSAAEFEVYETLKAQLKSIVSALPPYMLSKLDGDNLGALNISTKIQVEGKNQKGTLQEDELSAKVRVAARTAVPPVATQTSSAYGGTRGTSGYHQQTHTPSNQYSRPPYGAPASVPRPGVPQSYPSSHYAGRAPTTGYVPGGGRPSYTPQSSYGAQRPPSYTERFTNGGAQYATPQTYSSYANGGFRTHAQQTTTYNQQYSTPQSRVPNSAAAQLQAYRATQSEYQQRAGAATGQGYGYGNTPVVTGGSPQSSPQHRLSFSAQGQSPNPQRPQLFHQHSSTHGSHSPQPQINGVGAGGASRMSPDEQAALMNRQKAQLAEAVQQMRQTSGTPQPPLQNGGSRNGTPSRH